MSCDWDIFCKDCTAMQHGMRVEMGLRDANHADDDLAKIVRNRERMETLCEIMNAIGDIAYIEWQMIGKGFDLYFFVRHKGHALALVSEYGDVKEVTD